MSKERFEELVEEALDSIPPAIASRMENVSVSVETRPPRNVFHALNLPPSALIFGFYHGVPLSRRGTHYGGVLPDYIAIYQEPIVEVCATQDEIITQVVRTVVHEVGHHFGFSDRQLRELGY